jgi:PAS domain S-box-containing protein
MSRLRKSTESATPQGTALRRRAEEIARKQAAQSPRAETGTTSSENPEALSPEKTRKTLHELRVHQIELEMQNEELRRAQVELDAARSRYFGLYDLAPVGYCTISEQGLILEANLTAASLLGVPRGELVKQPINRFILKEDHDIYYLHRKQLFEAGELQAYDLRMVTKDGTAFWARLDTAAAQDPLTSSALDADGASPFGEPQGSPVCRVALSDITELKEVEKQLRRSLEEKEVLLREVHHRVKNNLNVISSLLNLQASNIQTPEQALAAFRNSSDRIMSMALVHEELYNSRNYARVDMGEYLDKLTRQLLLAYGPGGGISLSAQAGGISLSVDTSIPCGLILNELITNAFKHAFPKGGPGDIHVLLRTVDDDSFELCVSDNGIGLPEGCEGRGTLGLTLVRLLTEQLEGTTDISTENGTRYRIRFSRKGEA